MRRSRPHLSVSTHSAQLCDLPRPTGRSGGRRPRCRRTTAVRASSHQAILSRGVEHGPRRRPGSPRRRPPTSDVRHPGIRVVTLDRGYDRGAPERAPWLLLGAKTLSYAVNMAAIREAQRRGADDAVFVSSDGILLEAPTASVVLRIGDRFVSPEPGAGEAAGHHPGEPVRPPARARPQRDLRAAAVRGPRRGGCRLAAVERAPGRAPICLPSTARPKAVDAELTSIR